MIKIDKLNKKQKKYALVTAVVLAVALIFSATSKIWMAGRTITIENENNSEITIDNSENKDTEEENEEKERNLINGVECENAKGRPFAVMLAGDLEAWPLSGIAEADLVIEMPVVTNGITRYVAIYVCDEPSEIGSIRSSRHDFIPLVMGFDAIYAHWGGSHYALDKLNNKIMDNVNALYLDGSVFYRKSGLPKPHDGFTTIKRLREYSERIGYRLENEFEGYKFHDKESPIDKNGKLSIGYPSVYKVEYEYNAETNFYLRSKGDKEDTDRLTSEQISAKNVVIMFAASRQIEGQYNDMDIEGEGDAIVYQNGWEIKGKWKKDKSDMKSKLYFYNEAGEEIKFVPGKIWIQVVQTNQKVEWGVEK
ncbi:MAG: DUF3048 domain-containing protein [Candidatus Pacebacteria bacterium]|nr:DUF3048 domain-containing protein [Candidatus Paceibacterota bacterium]